MGHTYKAVGFNRQKYIYDGVVLGGIVLYLALFMGIGLSQFEHITAETLIIRALSTSAFVLLHVILSIGPLARIDNRFLPFLYNRRHLGVVMALLAVGHGIFSLFQFHMFGDLNPLASVLSTDGSFWNALSGSSPFPFQPFGFAALVIIAVMAATSHDFWLSQFSAPVWKKLHMLVYLAYTLLIVHVAFGVGQESATYWPLLFTSFGAGWLVSIHIWAGVKSHRKDSESLAGDASEFINAGPLLDIEDGYAISLMISGETVALFRDGQTAYAVSGICQHQNGPLAEGRIIDGFITCPWHGYQYCPRSGKSPEPFSEHIPTFETHLEHGEVWIRSTVSPV
ncbi:ferric reductase-like transmembrane domain-containing protein [bacterium]|nr:ferric reductase-like transmembrane domain-containing protein [bacterium]